MVPAKGIIERFEIDPTDYTDFEIANFLWNVIEGQAVQTPEAIKGMCSPFCFKSPLKR